MEHTEPDTNRFFPTATGQTTARRNLLSHLLLIANQLVSTAALSGQEIKTDERCAPYLDALRHIMQVLDPSAVPGDIHSPESAAGFFSQLQKIWAEIVIGGADPARSEQACAFAHKMLARSPVATSFYVHECAHTFAEPQQALDLLAQASRFITDPMEAEQVGRAQSYAMRVLLQQKKLPPVENPAPEEARRLSSLLPAVIKKSTSPAGGMVMTENHRAALEKMTAMGELFFAQPALSTQLSLRTSILLVGPTGAGKSFLVRQAAERLKADYYKITRSGWIPRGVRESRPTVFRILDRLLATEQLCLHADECDKWNIDQSKEWSASIADDLWNTLDKFFQVQDYLTETKFRDAPIPTIEEIERKIRTKLWIVGSGTWQSVFAQGQRSASLGFNPAPASGQVTAEAIAKSGAISPELLLRFNSDLVFLNYPSPGETVGLLQSTGITALAEELGITISPADVNWSQGGMRVLETIATRLTLEKFQRGKRDRRAPRRAAVSAQNQAEFLLKAEAG